MSESMKTWYDFVLQQMASEAYLEGIDLSDPGAITNALIRGNNRENFEDKGRVKLTDKQVEEFLERFQIIHQASDNPTVARTGPVYYEGTNILANTGLSATLIRKKDDAGILTSEYTLSIRSTESRNVADGGDRDRDGYGADLAGIFFNGFALAQLSALEDYFAWLKSSGMLPQGSILNVTGYSLGGHLATVFTEMHAADIDGMLNETYTFNGAGRGTWSRNASDPNAIVAYYKSVLANPDTAAQWAIGLSATDAARIAYEAAKLAANAGAALNPTSIYVESRHQWAQYAAEQEFGLSRTSPFDLGSMDLRNGAADRIAQLYGKEFPTEATGVANAGIHGPSTGVFVEAQPFIEGQVPALGGSADWGNAHSLTLIADALALMRVMQKIDPSATLETLNGILSTASATFAQSAVTGSGANAKAEDDALEDVLDALRRLFIGSQTSNTPYTPGGSGFGNIDSRNAFHDNVFALEQALGQAPGSLTLASLAGQSASELTTRAQAANGLAYRYALKELNPFAVLGPDSLYASHNTAGELELFASPGVTPVGMSAGYIADRAAMLAFLSTANTNNTNAFASNQAGDQVRYIDLTAKSDSQITDFLVFLPGGTPNFTGPNTRLVQFGTDAANVLFGRDNNDHLYGGRGNDTLTAGGGDDYLEGGSGIDKLEGGDGNDTLFADDGQGGDILNGGKGFDTYIAEFGDSIIDAPEASGSGEVYVYLDGEKVKLTGGTREGDKGSYTSADGRFKYWSNGNGEMAVFKTEVGTGDTALRIETPTATVPGLFENATQKVSGRPDLGISLVAIKDPRPQASNPSADVKGLFDLAKTWRPATDPLALDLGGNGFQTVGDLGAGTILFDHDGNSVRNGTGWLTGADAWVVLDRNGDGLITTGGELFGINTVMPDGSLDADGFTAIAPLDTDQDNKVDANDGALAAWQISADADGDGIVALEEERGAAFADLKLWRDENLNGISEPFELSALADNGIVSINLSRVAANQALPGGNTLLFRGTYTRSDGTSGTAGALQVTRETFYRDFTGAPNYAAGVENLPRVNGTGRVRDLQEAAADSEVLRQLVESAASATDRAAQAALVDQVLQQWAADSAMRSGAQATHEERGDAAVLIYSIAGITAGSVGSAYLAAGGGEPINPNDLPADWYESQQSQQYRDAATKIGVLERFMGQTFADVTHAASYVVYSQFFPPAEPGEQGQIVTVSSIPVSIGEQNWKYLQDAYAVMQESVLGSIAVQTRLVPYIDAIVAGSPARDFSVVEGMLEDKRAVDPAGALSDLVELGRYLGADLIGRGWVNLPMMIREWSLEALADPSLSQIVSELRIRVDDGTASAGTALGDVLVSVGGSTAATGFSGEDFLFGSVVAGQLNGGRGADVIYGGPGNQDIVGEEGRDIILFGRGSGIDRSYAVVHPNVPANPADRDILQLLPGISPEDVLVRHILYGAAFAMPQDGIKLSINGTSDTFFDQAFFAGDYRSIEAVRFADGTFWDFNAIRLKTLEGTEGDDTDFGGTGTLRGSSVADFVDGRGGDDRLEGVEGDDTLAGGSGRDDLIGGPGDDALAGGSGDDYLEGGFGSDTLDGGAGDDRLYGGPDVDHYVMTAEGGSDVIVTGGADPVLDVLRVDTSIDPSSVRLQRRSDGLHIFADGTNTEFRDSGSSSSANANPDYAGAGGIAPSIGRIEFADGSIWTGAQIKARALQGYSGSHDEIYGYDNTGDQIHGGGGDDTLSGIGGSDSLFGDAGNDVLDGGTGNDILDGGEGNDTLLGGTGTDTAVIAVNAGQDTTAGVEIISYEPGVTPQDVDAWRQGNDLFFQNTVTGDLVKAISGRTELVQVEFSGGTVWGQATLLALKARATNGNDVLEGTEDDDTISALAGNDTVHGFAGNDVLDGGSGVDSLYGGSGHDTYFVDNPSDQVIEQFAEGVDTVYSSSAYTLSENVENLVLMNSATFGGGNGGDNVLTGNAVANTLFGGDGADTLDGAGGNDTLAGGSGTDIYRFARGGGIDYIQDTTAAGDANILRLESIAPSEVSVTGSAESGFITLGIAASGGQVVLSSTSGAGVAVSTVEFDDGTVWSDQYLLGLLPPPPPPSPQIVGTPGDDVLIGDEGDNQIIGLEGNDLLVGGLGNDYLEGDEGDDSLVGNSGDDFLLGGAGDDLLDGAGGSDTYLLEAGDGNDWILDLATTARFTDISDIDTIQSLQAAGELNLVIFNLGISLADVVLTAAAGNLVIKNDSAGVQLHIAGFDPVDALGLHSVKAFAFIEMVPPAPDQPPEPVFSILSYVQLLAQGFDFVGTGAADVLYGTNLDDRFDGGAGDDVLQGDAGNDTYVFGLGDGNDHIFDIDGTSGNTDTLSLGSGILPTEVTVSADDFDVHLNFQASGEQMSFGNWRVDPNARIERVEFADGTVWDLAEIESRIATNHAPTLGNAIADQSTDEDSPFSFTVPADTFSDSDAGDVLSYTATLADGSDLPAWLSFDPATEAFSGTPPQEDVGSFEILVSAADNGGLSAEDTFALDVANVNDKPVVSAFDTTMVFDDVADAASLLSVSDEDGGDPAQYEFWDSTAGNGHFAIDGAEQGVNVAIPVTAEQLATTTFVAASSLGSDLVRVRANDGRAWSDWKSWTINSWPRETNAAPVVSASNGQLLINDSVAVSSLFSVTDADGDPVTQYELRDDINGGGHFAVNGVQQAAAQSIPVSAADLEDTDYIGGANAGTEQVWARANDGLAWGAWKNWLMSTEGGMLRGGLGSDTLTVEAGPTVLEGPGGDDSLIEIEGDNLFSNGTGGDQMTGGDANDIFVGGTGDDTVETGAGNNIVSHNAGDGIDTVYSDALAANTLSLGGGLTYDDLSLSRNGDDLVLNTGGNDAVVLKDWYAGKDNVLNLQLVLDATNEFDVHSQDPLYNSKVQTFDFLGLVGRLDQALAQSPGLTSWAVTNALLQFHLSAAHDAALGGDLAYGYGKSGGLTGISLQAAQQVIGAPGFGSDAQSLRPFNGIQEGFAELS